MNPALPTRPRVPVTFLVFDACGGGGVARTVIALANRLSETHDVRLLSLFRRRDQPRFAVDPAVRTTWLVEDRRGAARRSAGLWERRRSAALAARPTRLRPEVTEHAMSAATDRALARALGALPPGILVSTRPSLHLAAATWAPPHVALVGQDHLNFPTRFANARQAVVLRHVLPRLDSWVVLTEADARDYANLLPTSQTPVTVLRNALSWDLPPDPGPRTSRTVVAAGRLAPEKGFDRLVDAWGPVAEAHPGWVLDIHGEGALRRSLQQRIDRAGLTEVVRLRGYADDIGRVFAEAALFVMSSRREGFPMVLLEAMSTGLPLVAMDCPRGPGEIVTPTNGRLVPDGDVPALTGALVSLLDDPALRQSLGARARHDAEAYLPEVVTDQWRAHLDTVADRTGLTGARGGRRRRG